MGINARLAIQERLKDLRVNDRGLTLEQLAKATGLSRSALGNYESNEFKDISPFSIATLAQLIETINCVPLDMNSLIIATIPAESRQGKLAYGVAAELRVPFWE